MNKDASSPEDRQRIAMLEREVQVLQARLREADAIIRRSPAVVFLWRLDPEWPVEFVSDGVRQFGYTPDDFYTGRVTWVGVTHPDDVPHLEAEVERYTREGRRSFHQEYRILTRDGEVRRVSDDTVAICDADGRVTHYQGIILDITTRTLAEEGLQRSQQLFATLFQTMPIPIALSTPEDGRYLQVNSAFERITGFLQEEVVGRTSQELGVLRDSAQRQVAVARLRAGEPVTDFELPFYPKRGQERTGLFSAHLLTVGDRTLLLTALIDITERKQAEDAARRAYAHLEETVRQRTAELAKTNEALRESERHYRELYTRTPVMMHTIDAQGRLLDVSDTWLTTLGYTREEVVGRKSIDFLTEESRQQAVEVDLPRFFTTGDAHEVPYQFVKKNGEVIDVLLSAILERDDAGQVTRAIGVLIDVTERKCVEDALRESEERYRTITETAQEGIWVLDPQGITTYVNPFMANMLGYTVEEMLGQSLFAFMNANQRALAEDHIGRRLQGVAESHEFRLQRKDGCEVIVLINTSPLYNHQGQITGMLGMLTDITARQQAEAALLESERTLATLMSNLPGMAFRCAIDQYWTMAFISEGALALTGYTPQALMGNTERSYASLIHPDDQEMVWTEIQHALQRQEPYTITYRIITATGDEKWVWEQGREVMIDGAPPMLEGLIIDISERKAVEAQLQASEARYRSLFEDSPISLWEEDYSAMLRRLQELSARGIGNLEDYLRQHPDELRQLANLIEVRAVNQATLDLYGARDVADLTGRLETVFTPEAFEFFLQEALAVARGEMQFAGETYQRRLDGQTLYVSLRGLLFPGHEGASQRMLISVVDLTERKAAEEAMRRSEEFFKTISEFAPFGVYLADARGQAVYVNRRWEEIAGYSVEESLGEGWQRAVHPDDRGPFLAQWLAATARGEDFEATVRLLRPDGVVRWIISRARAITLPQTGEPGFIGNVIDITERKVTEERLEHLLGEVERWAAEMDATISAIADGVIIYGPHAEVVRLNASARTMLGYQHGVPAQPFAERLRAEQVETADGTLLAVEDAPPMRALQGETVKNMLLAIQPKEEQVRWVSVSAAPIYGPDQVLLGAVATLSDVTAMHDLQQRQEDLLRIVSHDLRIPLTVIKGHMSIIEEILARTGVDGLVANSTTAIDRSVERLNAMIGDLVDMARIEGGQLSLDRQPIEPAPFLHDLRKRLEGTLAVERISIRVPDDLPAVAADPNRLERILLNLLSNALKYSREDTAVEVRGRVRNGYVELAVVDHGRGIDPDDLPHLFDRFFRARGNRRAEGIGLGLYITRLLVKAHGGAIRVNSVPGRGSTFLVDLPVAK